MATLAPVLLATDIPSLLAAEPMLDPIAIAAAAMLESAENELEINPQLLHPPRPQVARDAKAFDASARVDWRETSTAHIFKVDLPGVTKEQIKVQIVEGSALEICGERKKEEVQETDTWHLVERASSWGFFLRRFRLPENANTDAAKAHVEDGVLTITISKLQKPEPQVLWIPIT